MKKILFLSFLLVTALLQQAMAQVRAVSGTVTDASTKQPLPGVTVLVKGTTVGTATGADGTYSVGVPDGSNTLVFSFVGYATTERAVGNATTIDVALPLDTKQLSEVVVTALGIEKTKNELPYAAQKVGGDEVSKTRETNFVNALSGKVSGVQIQRNNNLGGSTNVVIRGSKSIGGSNQALFVVDGVPIDNSNTNSNGAADPLRNQQTGRGGYDYGNAAADINPDDIASITVLKGAAASALYGSRAGNGVIMITTKKGSKNKGIGVTVNAGANWGIIDNSTFVDYQKQYGAGYGPFYGPNSDAYFNEADIDGDGVVDFLPPYQEDASFGGAYDPNIQYYPWSAFDPTAPNYLQKRPWVAAENDPRTFFRNSHGTASSVTIDGGGEQGYFKLGYSRNTDYGILPNSRILKDYVNFAASYNLNTKLTASASINYTDITGKGRYGTGYDDKNVATNFRQWWQTNVDIQEQEDAYRRTGRNMTWNIKSATNLSPAYWDNPYFTRYKNYENDNRGRFFGNVRLDYKFAEWLNVMGRISLDTYEELQEERYAVGSLSPSEYSRFNRNFSEYNYDLMANFNKDLSELFNLKATIGTNIRKTHTQSIFAVTNGGLVVPDLYSLSNSLNPLNAPYETDEPLQVNGYFASVTLGYKQLAFVDASYRVDQASTLPSNNNTFTYPSISGSFVFSELMEPNYWLTSGKIRANYAEVGQGAPFAYTRDAYFKPDPFGGNTLFSVPGTKSNPDLKPERSKSYEIGTEMSFMDGRAGFDLSYYKTNSVDQILPVPVSRSTGYDFLVINAGDVENKGFELSVYGTPVKTDAFSWTINANWTRNRNLVKDLGPIQNYQIGAFQGGVSINAAVGESYGTIKGRSFVYNDQGQRVVDEDGYYLTTATSNNIIGDLNPDWIGGISNTFQFKGVSLGFLIDVKHGGDVFSLDQYYGQGTGVSKLTAFTNDLGNPVRNPVVINADGTYAPNSGGYIFPGVKEDGTPNDTRVEAYTAFGYNSLPPAEFVYDAGFVKLREATLSYSLPESVVSKFGLIKGIDISAYGRNLWIIHKNLPYADPEDGLSSGNLTGGYQVGSYPTTRNIGFNVRARF
ncbi:SusC/RagA family TonB-linked outer membrane protein [Pontibacter liquoris]|uniref:SusC/RagA family TonB-linked outer membrane protein n=1 Tax=Pontibacter liquoris TaxID=2905677 RepID=UPI001FA736BB|nr:SusC/RagA family TonB-linked outer membrane protein [Pontibacter liquoris]